MNKNILMTFGAIALVSAAATASADTYTIVGSGTTTMPAGGSLGPIPLPPGSTISNSTATGTATGDATSITGVITQDVTSTLAATLHMQLSWNYTINSNSTGTKTLNSCTDLGATLGCPSSGFTVGVVVPLNVSSLNFSNPSLLSWETTDNEANATLNGTTSDVQTFRATLQAAPPAPTPPPPPAEPLAVPALPLAGLGLLVFGLAGIGASRMRRK